jgi:DNA-directed RNA polymerase I subunit RPA1
MSDSKLISSVKFVYLTTEEVRKLSAVEVTETEIFAQLQSVPIPGGLYDLRMGPVERGDTCKTCGRQAECPGHLGHIELACEVYNPFLMKQLYSLIKKCCTRCFRFRLNAAVTAKYVDKFQLLARGHEVEMEDIPTRMIDESKRCAIEKDSLIQGSGSQTMHWTNASQGLEWSEQADEKKTHSERNIKILKDSCSEAQRRKHFDLTKAVMRDPLLSPEGGMGACMSTGEIGAWNRLVSDFLSEIPVTSCENCGLPSNTFRVDGYSRIFMKPRKASKDEEKYLTPSYVHASLVDYLWKNEQAILRFLFPGTGSQGANVFFLRNVVVPPNRFRPLRVGGGGDGSFLPANTQALKSIIEASEAVRAVLQSKSDEKDEAEELGTAIIALQDRVNTYMDSTKSGRSSTVDVKQGVRQLLERKQGLFRMKMMGKRVNYACRSVISPDVNLETNQIGLPRFAAMQLSVPEPVFAHNVDYLRQLVLNGPDLYPGATAIEYPDGRVVSLVGRTMKQREALAKSLYVKQSSEEKPRIVMRHVRNGDPLLVNRQPTLHKPGIMAMLIRILHREKTIRMHYVNCNTFNADFDGDEMNLHCPQDPVARAEALYIANADVQFLGPTAGNPLRGLIQDNIASAALLTGRGTMLNLEQVYQLLYAGLRAALEGDSMVNNPALKNSSLRVACYRDLIVRKGSVVIQNAIVDIIEPAILKPYPLWTGKQVMTMLLRSLIKMCAPNERAATIGLNHSGKSRTPGDLWGGSLDGNKEEETILIQDSELLTGVIDKNSVGTNAGGLAHVVYELCGPSAAGLLMTGVSRMFTLYLQWRGFSCCMRDLLIKKPSENLRADLLKTAREGGWNRIRTWVSDRIHLIGKSMDEIKSLVDLQEALRAIVKSQGVHAKDELELLEKMMLGNSSEFWGKTIDSVLPGGLSTSFPTNGFSAMVMTGAKGSKINQSQISCLLGQQELEGHRVPLMCTMKSLPSFAEFDLSSRAGGFVADRFLSGVRPQEFFFHCMAGREGLIDTAVKTARSGYLQRCLVKHMECLSVQYDLTVRDADSSVVQFLYGEDGLDILKSSYLKMPQVFKNNQDFLRFYKSTGAEDSETINCPDSELPVAYINWLRKRSSARRSAELLNLVDKCTKLSAEEKDFIRSLVERGDADPIEHVLNPLRFLGAVSAKHMNVIKEMAEGQEIFDEGLGEIFAKKFQASMADAGECVGTLAAQGMGEPSTQMTLNTFHLAGHGGANVTLGIPRLREIVQTASRKIATPSMFIPLESVRAAEELQGMMTRIALKDIIVGSTVEEVVICNVAGEKRRKYRLKLDLVNLDKLQRAYPQLTRKRIETFLQTEFRQKLDKDVRNFLRVSMQMSTQSQRQINDDTGLRVGARGGGGAGGEDDGERAEDQEEVASSKKKEKSTPSIGRVRKTDEDAEVEEEEESDGEGSDAGGQYDDVVDTPEKQAANREEEAEGANDETSSSSEDEDEGNMFVPKVKFEVSTIEESVVPKSKDEIEGPTAVVDQNAIFGQTGRLLESNSFVIESRDLLLSDKKVSRKILILEVVEELCSSLYVQQTIGITKVHVTNQNPKVGITTEGANIEFAWGLNGIDHSKIYTNDICKMLDHYGVEACRASIIKEIQNVFGHYGISVDGRHLSLIADYMTHQGGYRPFNRGGISQHSSPFLKMSFETSMNFLSAACHDLQMDPLKSPAAAIVVGKLAPVGTGVFDVINDPSVNPSDVGTSKYRNKKAVSTPIGKKRTSRTESSSASKRNRRFDFD